MNPNKKQSLKICFVCPKAYPLFNQEADAVFGGAEVDLYYLGTELAKDDNFEVSFVTADYGQPNIETRENVKIIRSLNFHSNPLSGAICIWQALQKADADIYMLKTPSPGLVLVSLFCRRNHKALVYRTASQRECDGTYLKEHFLMGKMFALSLRKCLAVFVQNNTDSVNLKHTLNIEAIVIPNGHRLSPPANEPRDYILWIGRSVAIKQPEKFLELAKEFPDEKFAMICQHATGDNNYDELKNAAAKISNLEFIDRVPFDQIEKWYQRSKVFVNTSRVEGFPNTFIQAGQAGTAILSLQVNPDNFLNEYQCGLSAQGEMNNLTQALKFLLENQRYIETGRNAQKYVEQKHDIKKIVETYKPIFQQITSRRPLS